MIQPNIIKGVNILLLLCLGLMACEQEDISGKNTPNSNIGSPMNLLFKSGFEAGTSTKLDNTSSRSKDIIGRDTVSGFDWQTDLEMDGREFFMNYVDGTDGVNPEMLGSDISNDPENTANKVFHTWQNDSEWHEKGYWSRVQGELRNCQFDEIFYKVRLRIDKNVEVVENEDWWVWCMMGIEIRPINDPSDHSLSTRIHRNSENRLVWGYHMRLDDENTSFKSDHYIKYDTWQTLEFYAKSGHDENGRILMMVDGQVIVDQQGRTVLTQANLWGSLGILKVYGGLIDVVTNPQYGNKPNVQVWFDDLEIWVN